MYDDYMTAEELSDFLYEQSIMLEEEHELQEEYEKYLDEVA